MEFIRPKIELYHVRTFSEKISDTFAYIRETWRPMLKWFVYLMLPLSIVLAFCINNFMTGYMDLIMGSLAGTASAETGSLAYSIVIGVALWLLSIVSSIVLTALVYAMLRLYLERDDRLKQLTTQELKPELMHCMKRMLQLLLASIVAVVLVVVLMAVVAVLMFAINTVVGVIVSFFLYLGFVALLIPFSLVIPIYLMEDETGVVEAFQKAWHLGWPTWGGIVAVSLVLGIVGSLLQTLTITPWYFISIFGHLFSLQGETGGFTGSMGFSFLKYLSCVWMCLGTMLVSVLNIVGLTIQYGHASDKIDGVGVAQGIERFDEFDNI